MSASPKSTWAHSRPVELPAAGKLLRYGVLGSAVLTGHGFLFAKSLHPTGNFWYGRIPVGDPRLDRRPRKLSV